MLGSLGEDPSLIGAWVRVRFSRHAKNRMRLYKVTRFEVLDLIEPENRNGADEHGNPIYSAEIRGIDICVVLALDDLSTIITVYDLEH
jgi:hypothetical protein